MQRPRTSVLLGFVFVCILLRLMPFVLYRFFNMSIDPATTIYPWNFSPFYSMCLFSAAFITKRHYVFLLMFGSWILGDIGIGLLTGRLEYAFFPHQLGVYGGFALLIAIGFVLRKHRSWPAIFGAGFAGACVFFVVSNFGMWALGDGTIYPHTAAGLRNCYVAAIPFFRNTLVSMAIFLPVLFSGFAVKSEAPETTCDLAVQTG